MDEKSIVLVCVTIMIVCLVSCVTGYYLMNINHNNQTVSNTTSIVNNSDSSSVNLSNNSGFVEDSSSDSSIYKDKYGETYNQRLKDFAGDNNPDSIWPGEYDDNGNPVTYREAFNDMQVHPWKDPGYTGDDIQTS